MDAAIGTQEYHDEAMAIWDDTTDWLNALTTIQKAKEDTYTLVSLWLFNNLAIGQEMNSISTILIVDSSLSKFQFVFENREGILGILRENSKRFGKDWE